MAKIRKFLVMVVGAVAATVSAAITDGVIDNSEWANIIVLALGAIQVWYVANVARGGEYAKGVVAAATAAVTLIFSYYSDGISGAEWWQIAFAAFAAVGVVGVANQPELTGTLTPEEGTHFHDDTTGDIAV